MGRRLRVLSAMASEGGKATEGTREVGSEITPFDDGMAGGGRADSGTAFFSFPFRMSVHCFWTSSARARFDSLPLFFTFTMALPIPKS